MFGPTLAGFSIDLAGHKLTYLFLALIPAAPAAFLIFFAGGLPHAEAANRQAQKPMMDLVRNVPLRRALVTAGIIETGLELFNFYMPIYGHSLGLAAAAFVLFPFFTSVYLLIAISFVLGLGLGCGSPLSLIITYNRAPDGRSGEAMGMRQTANKFIQVLVPVIVGTLGSAFGVGPAFWLDALLLSAGAFIMKADARSRVNERRVDAAHAVR